MTGAPFRSWRGQGIARKTAARLAAPFMLACLAVIALFVSGGASHGEERIVVEAAPLPPRPERLIVGVGTHFGIGGDYNYRIAESARLIDDVGFDSFRDDLDWPAFQGAGGRFPARLGEFIAATRARPLLILTAGNRLIKGANPPVTDAGRAAYAAFAGQVAATPEASRMLFELGNEWNLTAARDRPFMEDAGPPHDPRAASNYLPLARAAIASIRAARPQATILTGAAGTDPHWLWVRAVAAGLPAKDDALSVHYYNHCKSASERSASDAIGQMEKLKTVLSSASPGRMPKLYVTEIGWPTATSCAISRGQSAANLSQFLLWSMVTPWIHGVWLYQLKDQGRDAAALEDNFGLYDYDYNPKPAACMVKASIGLIRAMHGGRVAHRSPGLTVLDYSGDEGRKLIAWTNDPGASAVLRLQGQARVESRRLCGSIKDAGEIALDNVPVVISAPKAQSPVTMEVRF
jgi:hypothetical protein